MTENTRKKRAEKKPEEDRSKKPSSEKNRKGEPRNLFTRISLRIIKILLIWIPAVLIVLIAVLLIALELYLSPERVEELIIANFNELSYGTISLKVRDFSPYGGFEMDKILILNGEEFNKTKFVEIDKLVVRYGLFSMLIGNVHIDEIGIYRPRIYLKEKNGVWNAARLMKPGKEKPEEIPEVEEISEEGPPSKEINLPVSVEFLFKFILDDLRLYVNGSSFNSSAEGLTYTMDIRIPPFKTIPKSIEAVSLLKTMNFELNPKGEMDIFFSSREAGVKTPLMLNWKLFFDKGEEKRSAFESSLNVGTYKAPVRFQKTHLAPLDFIVSYDLTFYPVRDILKLSHLDIKFMDKKWIGLTGLIKQVTTKQEIDLKMAESNIVLDDLYPYFVSITGDRRTKFRGVVSLFPLTIDGNPEYMNIDGEINLKKIYFKNPGAEADIPSLQLLYSVKKRSGDMKISSGIKIPHLFYTLERDRSGDNGLDLDLDVFSYNNFEKIDINFLKFKFYNPAIKKDALTLALEGKVRLKPELSGNVNITRFTFLKEPLLGMLPGGIKKSLVSAPVNKPVNMSLDLEFALGTDATEAKLAMLLKVPDYNVEDLKINTSVFQDNIKKRVSLKKFTLGTETLGLSVNAGGTIDIKTPPFNDSDLRVSVKLDSPEMKPIYGPWKLSGIFELAASMKGDLKTGRASGNILIDRLFVKNDQSMLRVDDVNLDFPFEYSFQASGPGESRIAVNKGQVIDNENFKAAENFSIKSIRAKHPSRDMQFEYMKDFAATMFFKNNAFEIVKLKTYILDGAVYGRDIIFNLADMPYTGSFKNIEYRLVLDVTNVDIGQLDNPDPKAKTREAELSLNANFSGRGLDMFAGKGKDRSKELNVKGFININKVGERFANRLFKGLSEEKGESKLGIAQYAVDNSMSIKGFNYNLDMGLMYVNVHFERRLLGYIIQVEDVKFDRVPIQSYLNNIFRRESDEI